MRVSSTCMSPAEPTISIYARCGIPRWTRVSCRSLLHQRQCTTYDEDGIRKRTVRRLQPPSFRTILGLAQCRGRRNTSRFTFMITAPYIALDCNMTRSIGSIDLSWSILSWAMDRMRWDEMPNFRQIENVHPFGERKPWTRELEDTRMTLMKITYGTYDDTCFKLDRGRCKEIRAWSRFNKRKIRGKRCGRWSAFQLWLAEFKLVHVFIRQKGRWFKSQNEWNSLRQTGKHEV